MSGLLACVGKSFVKPPHTIRLKIKMRHDIRLFDRKISVGYGRFDFAGANDGGEVADAHPCSRHEVDPGPGPGSPREASVELLLLFPSCCPWPAAPTMPCGLVLVRMQFLFELFRKRTFSSQYFG